jgi:AmmeMemoRadiSam system protein B/AmmeMemoRadiSam system protein A
MFRGLLGMLPALSYHESMKLGSANAVRPAAVAGMFYPGDARSLAGDIADYLDQTAQQGPTPGFPKVVIVPHAGYIYSGPVAASAYDLLRPARGVVKRVVLLGPCHRVPVRGLALPGSEAFETPLGRIPVDVQAIGAIRGLPQVVESAATHAQEHALEVQLPFLQRVLGEFSLVPLVVGDCAPDKVAEVLERLWGGVETLIVVSSDLSHYHPYEVAREIDGATVRAILAFDARVSHEQACGATPVSGALIAAKGRGLKPRLLDCRNSGDTAGGRNQVVGYASFALHEENSRYEEQHGERLLEIARASIAEALGFEARKPFTDEPWLREWRATFVTLKQDEALRGCVGLLGAQRPLADDVAANARAAAFQDTRFEPLTREELARTDIEVSLLSVPKRLLFEDHRDLIAQLRPGVDGIILECGGEGTGKRATFLPQVWEGLPDPEQFIAHLKQKAGLAKDTRTERCRVMRYTVLKWREAEMRT